MLRTTVFVFAFTSAVADLVAAQRTFVVVNKCSETLWPAVINFVNPSSNLYKGIRGWEAPPGHTQTLSLPSKWNGRIWPRRDCSFDSNGKGSCLSGNCGSGLDCEDADEGFLSLGEFNLDSWNGQDFYDLSFVAGFNVPMSIAPDGCQELKCSDDINAICPDKRMKQFDSDGKVIGCLSACMAGINAQESSMNCCSGKYSPIPKCVPSGVDYYSVFKPICPSAYWYPRDSRDGNPVVDWACPIKNSPKYVITFCPPGGKVPSLDTAAGTSPDPTEGITVATGKDETATTAAATAAADTATNRASPAAGNSPTSTTRTGALAAETSDTFPGAASPTEPLLKTASSDPGDPDSTALPASDSASMADAAESVTAASDDIFGMPNFAFYGLCALVGVAVVATLGWFVRRRRPRETASSDSDAAASGGASSDSDEDVLHRSRRSRDSLGHEEPLLRR
ncbi:hypothetical protein JCM8202_005217 [Rhodotorula sphaerocarpa]